MCECVHVWKIWRHRRCCRHRRLSRFTVERERVQGIEEEERQTAGWQEIFTPLYQHLIWHGHRIGIWCHGNRQLWRRGIRGKEGGRDGWTDSRFSLHVIWTAGLSEEPIKSSRVEEVTVLHFLCFKWICCYLLLPRVFECACGRVCVCVCVVFGGSVSLWYSVFCGGIPQTEALII